MHLNTDCPCKSGKHFDNCCKPILIDHSLADTPEKLMRSRYTAFVIHDADYLLRTWSGPHRPQTLEMNGGIIWVNLEICEAILPLPEQKIAHVSFIASFIQESHLHFMKETSSFILLNGLWFYKEGTSTVQKSKVAMKATCPCGSGKKFKRCCHSYQLTVNKP